jgi:hypothetical protein
VVDKHLFLPQQNQSVLDLPFQELAIFQRIGFLSTLVCCVRGAAGHCFLLKKEAMDFIFL